MYTGLVHAHEGLAYLFLLSTSISVLLALVVCVAGNKSGLVKLGTVLARFVEMSLGGLIGLLGIGMWAMNDAYGATAWWLWVGLVGVAASAVLIARGIKPCLTGLTKGEDGGRMRWLALAALHWVLIWGMFGLMHAFALR